MPSSFDEMCTLYGVEEHKTTLVALIGDSENVGHKKKPKEGEPKTYNNMVSIWSYATKRTAQLRALFPELSCWRYWGRKFQPLLGAKGASHIVFPEPTHGTSKLVLAFLEKVCDTDEKKVRLKEILESEIDFSTLTSQVIADLKAFGLPLASCSIMVQTDTEKELLAKMKKKKGTDEAGINLDAKRFGQLGEQAAKHVICLSPLWLQKILGMNMQDEQPPSNPRQTRPQQPSSHSLLNPVQQSISSGGTNPTVDDLDVADQLSSHFGNQSKDDDGDVSMTSSSADLAAPPRVNRHSEFFLVSLDHEHRAKDIIRLLKMIHIDEEFSKAKANIDETLAFCYDLMQYFYACDKGGRHYVGEIPNFFLRFPILGRFTPRMIKNGNMEGKIRQVKKFLNMSSSGNKFGADVSLLVKRYGAHDSATRDGSADESGVGNLQLLVLVLLFSLLIFL